uniref:Uncharacterized protein n=1 Tax=Anguilla anguilla TaxID=7936 RepID=A0A0E9X790_ANGAN
MFRVILQVSQLKHDLCQYLSRQFTFSVGYTTRLHLPHNGFMFAGY